MKKITIVTTTTACDDTFDKIQILNKDFIADHYKKNLIILRGNFVPDVFEWVENPNNPSWWRYWHSTKPIEITKERYNYYLEVLPPIYFSHLDGEKVSGGFCVAEAYTHTNGDVPVFTACYKTEGRYYETLAVILKHDDNVVKDYNAQEFSSDNYAISYKKQP